MIAAVKMQLSWFIADISVIPQSYIHLKQKVTQSSVSLLPAQ